jgi:Skp family chaperone for outer membrane proteins
MFEQFDGYVTSAATTKLVQATEKVARASGYDIVIRKKDVIMYRNNLTVDDITEAVKAEISGYL